MNRVIAFWMILLAASSVSAKCASVEYSVSGRVLDVRGRAVLGAHLVVSHLNRVWYEPYHVTSQSGKNGNFSASFMFYPYSGQGVNGDECDAEL